MEFFCCQCGGEARHLEDTEPAADGEYKRVLTCDDCQNIMYLIANIDNEPLPDHGDWAEPLALPLAPEEDHE